MGKRSNFKRVERDFYPTPKAAVMPLLPHLGQKTVFAEPCAGDFILCRYLEAAGHTCLIASDISPADSHVAEMNAMDLTASAMPLIDCIITNPPWNRKILHPMIEHFSAMRPTWLLFDSDWVHTKQSAPFMPWLVKIVSVGRVKWIPDSKMTGKDNCAWHLFDQNHNGPTEFIGRKDVKL